MTHQDQTEILRWDPIFLAPLNHHARTLATVVDSLTWDAKVTKVLLHEPGDTVLIDNWRVLHGRSHVLPQSAARHIERVYLSEVFQ
jgi:hypothetical protein